jgi:hypothetical protein
MNIFAYTAADGIAYPGFVSINKNTEGDIEVTVRSAPKVVEGSYICGFKSDTGKPGRCTPDGPTCNNYCNLAPDKGPMQPRPLPCDQVIQGAQAMFTVPAAEWAKISAE